MNTKANCGRGQPEGALESRHAARQWSTPDRGMAGHGGVRLLCIVIWHAEVSRSSDVFAHRDLFHICLILLARALRLQQCDRAPLTQCLDPEHGALHRLRSVGKTGRASGCASPTPNNAVIKSENVVCAVIPTRQLDVCRYKWMLQLLKYG